MDMKKKTKNNGSGGLYIALAICILSVICVGVYGAVLGLVKPAGGTTDSGSETRRPDVTVETPKSSTPASETPAKPTAPAPTEPVENQVEEPDQSVAATPASPEYVLPLVGSIVKDFSSDLLVYSETMNDYRVHNGWDMSAVIGERVRALTDGVVEKIYDDPLMGQTVIIDHGNGLKSVYQNLMPEVPDGVAEGAAVKAGDVIGGVGETALVECAQEPHLHFEVWRDNAPVDPKEFIQ